MDASDVAVPPTRRCACNCGLGALWDSGQPGARFALCVMTAINLFNYLDRFLPSAVKDLVKDELQLSDAETSAPITVLVLSGCAFQC